MKNWFRKLRASTSRFMQGRNGMDELSRFLNITGFILLLASCLEPMRFLYPAALVLWVWSTFRSFSKNTYKRTKERAAYVNICMQIKKWGNLQKRKWEDRKTHRYYRCKQCKTPLRVPKGKGRIKISCPNCHTELLRKT